MSLSADLISQFTKVTKPEETRKKESTVYGSIVKYGDDFYARIDGSDILTPISSTVDVKDGDRVSMLIKNHTAVVTGNFSKPAVNEDSQIFKGMVTFAGLSGGTTTIDGACIKTGKISADRLELTGAITWADLGDDAKNEIAANGGISSSQASTIITRHLVSSPVIKGAKVIGNEFSIYQTESSTQPLFTLGYHEEYGEDQPIVYISTPARNAKFEIWGARILGATFDHASVDMDGGLYTTYESEFLIRHSKFIISSSEIEFSRADGGNNTIDFTGATVTGLSVVFG